MSGCAKGLDWPALMGGGLHGLGLAPAVFWALTPVELQMMLGTSQQKKPMLSDGLAALMAAYPDTEQGARDG
ncbi:rcc01693 family protein [Sulfitobacter geojensis]|uniref:rcc01693 family protein n=1 Tax=Sulfitobacter geojensis TaxID=1342299 RepID=UPI000ABA71FA|nr:rcc01693 family protein [Sulfitobacter geojensis]